MLYYVVSLDEGLSRHTLKMLYQAQKPYRIPEIMEDYHVSEWAAEKIFQFMLHGNFVVNKSLGWNKNAD